MDAERQYCLFGSTACLFDIRSLNHLIIYFLLMSGCRMPDGGQRHLCDAGRRQPFVDRRDGIVRQHLPDARRYTERRRADLAVGDDSPPARLAVDAARVNGDRCPGTPPTCRCIRSGPDLRHLRTAAI